MGGSGGEAARQLLSFLPPAAELDSPSTWSTSHNQEPTPNSSTTTKTTTTSLTCKYNYKYQSLIYSNSQFWGFRSNHRYLLSKSHVASSLAKHNRPNPIFGQWWEPGWPLTIANSKPNLFKFYCCLIPIKPIWGPASDMCVNCDECIGKSSQCKA